MNNEKCPNAEHPFVWVAQNDSLIDCRYSLFVIHYPPAKCEASFSHCIFDIPDLPPNA